MTKISSLTDDIVQDKTCNYHFGNVLNAKAFNVVNQSVYDLLHTLCTSLQKRDIFYCCYSQQKISLFVFFLSALGA